MYHGPVTQRELLRRDLISSMDQEKQRVWTAWLETFFTRASLGVASVSVALAVAIARSVEVKAAVVVLAIEK